MFILNKYKTWYDNLINKNKTRTRTRTSFTRGQWGRVGLPPNSPPSPLHVVGKCEEIGSLLKSRRNNHKSERSIFTQTVGKDCSFEIRRTIAEIIIETTRTRIRKCKPGRETAINQIILIVMIIHQNFSQLLILFLLVGMGINKILPIIAFVPTFHHQQTLYILEGSQGGGSGSSCPLLTRV